MLHPARRCSRMVRFATVRCLESSSDPKVKKINYLPALFLTVGVVLTAGIAYVPISEFVSSCATSMYDRFSAGVVESQMSDAVAATLVHTNRYVYRPSIENQIKKFANRTDMRYLVVYGNKFTGKSCIERNEGCDHG